MIFGHSGKKPSEASNRKKIPKLRIVREMFIFISF